MIFNLYNNKRHEVYPELFKTILMANRIINKATINRFTEMHSALKEHNSSDISAYLMRHEFLNSQVEEITDIWLSDNYTAVKRIYDILQSREVVKVKETFEETRQLYFASELYLSNDVSDLMYKCINGLNLLVLEIEFLTVRSDEKIRKLTELELSNSKLIADLKHAMKEELSTYSAI